MCMQSTVACALEQHLLHLKKFTYRLDGDNVRFGLNKDLGFDEFVEVRCGLCRAGRIAFSRSCLQICAELREVVFAPVPRSKGKTERLRIPVEKSGGGV